MRRDGQYEIGVLNESEPHQMIQTFTLSGKYIRLKQSRFGSSRGYDAGPKAAKCGKMPQHANKQPFTTVRLRSMVRNPMTRISAMA
jgi:hypothetical protein